MVDAGPVGGTCFVDDRAGAHRISAEFGPVSGRRHQYGSGRLLLRESVVDGLVARLSVTVIPADVTDPASGRHRLG